MWPASRKSFPKQFYPLIQGKSFFELTYRRFRKMFKPSEIFVSTEERYVKLIKKQAPEIPPGNIISEPERKDNLAAVGLVTAILEKKFPGEVMIVSWSDQLIDNEEAFLKAIKVAGEYAGETGLIVSVDHKPTYPSIHNGWAKMGEAIDEYKGFPIVRITKHIEKPEEAEAKRFFISEKYLINTGYRAWKTDVMLQYYRQFVPDMHEGLLKITEGLSKTYSSTVLYREYHKFIKDSVEKSIFEKMPEDKRVTIPAEFGWRDAGTWELFYKSLKGYLGKDTETVVEGEVRVEAIDSDRNLIIGQNKKMIVTIGISGLAVIDTPDALLICRMDRSSEVKEVFQKLEKENPELVE